MPYEIETKDGIVIRNIPDNVKPDDPRIKAKVTNARQAAGNPMVSAEDRKMADPTAGNSFLQNAAAGAGKALYDTGRGVAQIAGADNRAAIDEAKKLDAPLMKTGGGFTGNLAANAGIMALPGAAATTVPRAAAMGAALGGIQPVASDESRTENMLLGAAGGGIGQGAANMVGRFVKPVQSTLDANTGSLARNALREGIPLDAADLTGSKPLKIINSVMENLPFTADKQIAMKEAKQRAFTAAVLKRAGMDADNATAEAMLSQKKTLGGALGDIAERNQLDFNGGLKDRLNSIVKDAEQHLPPEEVNKIAGTVKQILSGAEAGTPEQVVSSGLLTESGKPFTKVIPATPDKPMLGTVYQGWRQPLRDMADNTATGRYFGQLRTALDDAFKNQLTGEEAKQFAETSRKYANLKTIIDAMGGAGNLPARGQVAPNQLAAALARSVGKENKTLGVGDLNDLTKIGQLFVKDSIPDSGTAQRALYQRILTSPLEAVAGAIGGVSYPMQQFMHSKAGQEYLKHGLLPNAGEKTKLLAEALRRGAVGAGSAIPLAYSQ